MGILLLCLDIRWHGLLDLVSYNLSIVLVCLWQHLEAFLQGCRCAAAGMKALPLPLLSSTATLCPKSVLTNL
eukprot:5304667-Prorocentrum_lima.AAC.1